MNHGYNTRFYSYQSGNEYTEEEAQQLNLRQERINSTKRICWCGCCSLLVLSMITLTMLTNLSSRNIINITLI